MTDLPIRGATATGLSNYFRSDAARRRRSNPHQPQVGRGLSQTESLHGRVIVGIDLKFAGFDVDRDKLAIVIGAQGRAHPLIENALAKGSEFSRRALRSRHR
jgi:hypothetical protein